MRNIAIFEEEKIALRFWNYLQSEGIKSTLEEEGTKDWVIWVVDEEEIPSATLLLKKFNTNPDDPIFSRTIKSNPKQNQNKESNSKKKSRFKNYSLKEKWRIQDRGFGIACLCIIIISIGAYFLSNASIEIKENLLISEQNYLQSDDRLSEVFDGQIWRLVSPIFVHYSFFHIGMNMYILSIFGSQIEKRKGSRFLVLFILLTATISNLAEYKITGNNEFGGMSGVNYGLFGYIWIKSKFDPGDGLFIDQINVVILMGWFFICFVINGFGGVGGVGIANWVHAGGLITGSVWAYISARKWTRN